MNTQKLKNLFKDPKTNWKYIAVVAILAFIAGAVIMNCLSKTKTGFEFPQITLPERKDETKDWKTYRNEEYGFEFKYPENQCYVDKELYEELAEAYPEVYLEQQDVTGVYLRCPSTTETFDEDLMAILIDTKQYTSIDDYIDKVEKSTKEQIEQGKIKILKEKIIVGIEEGYKREITYTFTDPAGSLIDTDIVLFKKGNIFLVRQIIQGDCRTGQCVFSQILSTFRFLE